MRSESTNALGHPSEMNPTFSLRLCELLNAFFISSPKGVGAAVSADPKLLFEQVQ